MQYLGDFPYGATVYIPFATYDANGASVTLTGLAVTDIEVYRNGGVTQRASDAGYTLLDTDGIDFDTITGIHGFSIDTSDNTTAGFWQPGADYFVVVSSVTISAQTVNFVVHFSIENRAVSGLLQRTTIATLASQTSFTLTTGSADNNAYIGSVIVVYDQATPVQKAVGVISAYTGSTRTVTLLNDPAIFTMAVGDFVVILADRALKATVDNRTLDVSTGGEAGLDWNNIGSPTTAQNLSGTNIDVDQVVASVSGAVGSVTGAVGSVAAGGITAASIATDALGALELAADAIAEIADAVWDEDATVHQTQGTFGQAIGDPVADADTIWGLANTNLNATVGSRASQTSLDTVDDFLDTEIADIQARLPAALVSGRIDASVGAMAAGVITAASIADNAIDAAALAADVLTELRSIVSGTSDSGSTTTMIDATRTEADTDYWAGDIILFTSGNIAGQARMITAFDPATDTITFTPATTQAVATQTYEIIPGARAILAGITHTSARIPNVTLTDTVTTYTGNTPQTGDNFARLGAPAGASVSADILAVDNLVDDLESRLGTPSNLGSGATISANLVDVEGQTDDMGAAGAGLTAIPWNAAWDAEVQSEVDDALVARNLHSLILASGTADSGSTTTMVDAARTEADADYWKGRLIVFTSGVIVGQCAIITDFNAATDTFTFAPPLTQAVATQTYVILPGISVWDDTLAEHLAAGTTGNALNAAGAAGDPWSTTLPGAYGAGTAGLIVGTNLDATVSSRASQTSLNTVDDFIDTEIADIQARLPAALVGGRIDASVGAMAAGVVTAAAIATGAVDADAIAADAVTEIQSGLATAASIAALNNLSAAQVNTEVDTALADVRLDELLFADSDIDGAAPPTVGSVFHELLSATAGSFTFDQTTDSLEAIRNKETDIETDTAVIGAAGAGLTAVPWNAAWDAEVQSEVNDGLVAFFTSAAQLVTDVWAAATRVLTAGTNIVLAKGTGVTGFNDLSAAQVNAEVVDALNVDTYAEPGQGAPAATASLAAKINYLYKAWRNRSTQTTTTYSLYADDGTTVDQRATISDDATTFVKGEIVTGP